MKTTTTTKTTHYEIQKKRRESLLDEWKGYHKTVQKRRDVVMHDVPSRRIRSGVYAGYDGDRPTKNLDATVHELAPHTTTTIHRHSWDAIEFIESGRGWTQIDGQRIDWRPWDTLHLHPRACTSRGIATAARPGCMWSQAGGTARSTASNIPGRQAI